MRRLLGPLPVLVLTAVLLTACGDDEPGTADGRTTDAPTRTEEPTEPPTKAPPVTPPTPPSSSPGGVEHTVVALESATAAGGSTQAVATRVGEGGSTGDLLQQLTDPVFRETVEQRITVARVEGDLWAAVVAVGCDVPDGVSVRRVPEGYAIVADKVANPTPECFAPVTTVAVVAVTD